LTSSVKDNDFAQREEVAASGAARSSATDGNPDKVAVSAVSGKAEERQAGSSTGGLFVPPGYPDRSLKRCFVGNFHGDAGRKSVRRVVSGGVSGKAGGKEDDLVGGDEATEIDDEFIRFPRNAVETDAAVDLFRRNRCRKQVQCLDHLAQFFIRPRLVWKDRLRKDQQQCQYWKDSLQ